MASPLTDRELDDLAAQLGEPVPVLTLIRELRTTREALRDLLIEVESMPWGGRWPGRPHALCAAARAALEGSR